MIITNISINKEHMVRNKCWFFNSYCSSLSLTAVIFSFSYTIYWFCVKLWKKYFIPLCSALHEQETKKALPGFFSFLEKINDLLPCMELRRWLNKLKIYHAWCVKTQPNFSFWAWHTYFLVVFVSFLEIFQS